MKTGEQYRALSIAEFNKAAEKYESDHAGIYEMCKHDYPDILAELEKEPFDTLLDCGCGTAPMLSLLTERYPERHYTGMDITPNMLEKAREKGLPNTVIVEGDSENMPFEADSFDAIICSQSFHHYPNPQAFFNEVYRVLKPNGRLILRDNTASKPILWLMNHIELPLLVNLMHHGDVAVYSCEQVRAMCRNAGLTVELCEPRKGFRMHAVIRK